MTSDTELDTLLENPDRGFYLEHWFDINTISQQGSFDNMVAAARTQITNIPYYWEFPTGLILSYMYIQPWRTSDISPSGIQAIGAVLTAVRELGMKAIPRFVYIDNLVGDGSGQFGQVPSLSRIYGHIDQITPVLAAYKNDIHTIHAGFIGAFGEWELVVGQSGGVDSNAAATYRQGVMEKLVSTMLPALDGIYLQTRLPFYKSYVPGTTANQYYNRIGVNNDGFFGKNAIKSANGDPSNINRRMRYGSASYTQLVNEAYLTPQNGELFWSTSANGSGAADGYESIEQMSEHRYTSFSGIHGNYMDTGFSNEVSSGNIAMNQWRNQPIDRTWLETNGIIGCPSFFKKADNSAQSRNTYDFIRHHLGYYVELQSVTTTGLSKPGASVNISMPLINYGFSAAFNMNSGFAILDENNNVVSTTAAGNPETWYSRDPNYSVQGNLTHTLSAEMTLPVQHGRYKLAFYLKNTRGDFARTANDMETVNGYHILHEFEII